MEKSAYDFKVSCEDNFIHITQIDLGHDDSSIIIHPEQVDLLTKWLNEAKEQLLKDE